MAKTKTPFFGLGSQGSVGESITSQKRGRDTVLRQLPVPSDPYSLPQAYQRWLYQDYAHWWTQQTPATRQIYATAGSHYHLTGFQYWMKYNLTYLPDLIGWWRLDINTLPTTPDSSPNDNPGTVIGASPATGLIDGAFYFDGLNDEISIPDNPTLDLGDDDFTIEIIARSHQLPTYAFIVGRCEAASTYWRITLSFNYISFDLRRNALRDELICGGLSLVNNQDYHLLYTGDRDGNLSGFLDGIYQNSIPMSVWGTLALSAPISIAHPHAIQYSNITADNFIMYNRILDQTTIKRHAARRYSL